MKITEVNHQKIIDLLKDKFYFDINLFLII